MNRRRFYFQLVFLTIVLVGAAVFLQIFPAFQAYFYFNLFTVVFFAIVSVLMFLMSAKAAVSKDKNAFTRMVMGFTFGKLLLAVVIVIVYQRVIKPEGILFVIPFFVIYFAYTIFETMFLTKLGKIKAR